MDMSRGIGKTHRMLEMVMQQIMDNPEDMYRAFVVGHNVEYAEKILLPRFMKMCEDSNWLVERKSANLVFVSDWAEIRFISFRHLNNPEFKAGREWLVWTDHHVYDVIVQEAYPQLAVYVITECSKQGCSAAR